MTKVAKVEIAITIEKNECNATGRLPTVSLNTDY